MAPRRRRRTHAQAKGPAKPKPLSEEEKLRRENKRLLAEVAYLKKIAGLEGAGAHLKTQAVVTLKSMHDLDDVLAVADLARSTYYYQLKCLEKPDNAMTTLSWRTASAS